MLTFNSEERMVNSEQVSLIFGRNFLISLQEKNGDLFDGVRERIRNSKGKIRKLGTDYLAYALIDSVVDGYFNILEKIGELVEDIEDELITEPKPENLHTIHQLRREMILLRKSVWPLREVINLMEKEGISLIKKTTYIFLRDLYEHTIQIIDTIESYRDMVSGMLDTYLSSVSNRMNEVMKVLTIIATIFIPLTFIAGVWGMNFQHMPELKWPWIYPYGFWALMILIGGMMVFYFKRKHWL
jgi:magnesium transporter